MKSKRKSKEIRETEHITPEQITETKFEITSISLSSIPRLICVSMILIIVIQAAAVVAIMAMGILNGISMDETLAITQNLVGENLLSIGIAIVAMVVSVWVGLNIYLSISKEEYETLRKNISEMSEEYEKEKQQLEKIKQETQSSYFQNQKAAFIWKINSQRFIYPLSGFLAFLFEQKEDVLCIEDYQKLYELEVKYIDTTECYEQNKWQECFISARKLAAEYQSWSNFEKSEHVKWYATIRIADLIFYCFACQRRGGKSEKEVTIRQMEETIRDYRKFIEIYEEDIMNFEKRRFGFQTGETAAYIYNTIGYSYDLINQVDSANEERKQLAIENMKKAVSYLEGDENKKKARYLRNLGLTYQRQRQLEDAMEQYEASLKIDGTDYKTSVNIASITLQQIEGEMKLLSREKVYLDLDNNGFGKYKNELFKAEKMCLMSIANSVSFEDSYYKLAQVYIYLYFAEENTKYLDKAEEKLAQLEICGKEPTGYIFTKRNWYEAKGEYENALLISAKLKEASNNDVSHMKELYKKKIDSDADAEN